MATQGVKTNLDDVVVNGPLDVAGAAHLKGTLLVDGAVTYSGSTSGLGHALVEYSFFLAGAQTTGTRKGEVLVTQAGVIVGARIYAETAPTTSGLIVDVNKNGTSVFTTQGNRPTIAATAKDSGAFVTPDVTALVAGDRLSFDIDQIGSGVAGSDLAVTVQVQVALVA